jgi:glycerol 2-dehydrogenase (NADP+)
VFSQTKVPRSDYFVTTKLWSSDHQRVEQALDKSLKDLQLSYIDLYLMHWPVTLPASDPNSESYGKEDRKKHVPEEEWNFTDTWREMEKLLTTGKVRAIGVANFSTKNLEKLLKSAKIVPAVNQVECQPLLPQKKLHEYCQSKGIHQTAFGPLGGSGSTLHTHPKLLEIAKKHGAALGKKTSTGNVLLSWGIQRNWSVIPKSTNPERIRSNLQANFVLDAEDLKVLDSLIDERGGKGKRFNRPDWGEVIFHDDEGLDLE